MKDFIHFLKTCCLVILALLFTIPVAIIWVLSVILSFLIMIFSIPCYYFWNKGGVFELEYDDKNNVVLKKKGD